jgi:hypothetical protein
VLLFWGKGERPVPTADDDDRDDDDHDDHNDRVRFFLMKSNLVRSSSPGFLSYMKVPVGTPASRSFYENTQHRF